MVHLRKAHFLVATYNKLKMKKFGPCKVVKRHDSRNAYEVELPTDLNISPLFNISDLTKYYEGGDSDEVADIQWSILVATLDTREIEEILENHVGKSTRNKNYEEYLVKWRGTLVEDSSWLAREEVNYFGFSLNT